jgi:hypothetical protein
MAVPQSRERKRRKKDGVRVFRNLLRLLRLFAAKCLPPSMRDVTDIRSAHTPHRSFPSLVLRIPDRDINKRRFTVLPFVNLLAATINGDLVIIRRNSRLNDLSVPAATHELDWKCAFRHGVILDALKHATIQRRASRRRDVFGLRSDRCSPTKKPQRLCRTAVAGFRWSRDEHRPVAEDVKWDKYPQLSWPMR